jgi:hypothetical protein
MMHTDQTMIACPHCGIAPADADGYACDYCRGYALRPTTEPVYAIQHPDGYFVRTSAGQVKRFSTAASAKAHIDTLPVNGYAVVRYS